MARKRIRVKPKTTVQPQKKVVGGWFDNPDAGGKNMRWWGPGIWTDGAEPGGSIAPTTQPTSSGQSTSGGNLLSQYQAKLDPINQRSQGLLQDYSALSAQLPTFQQKLLDSIKQSEQYPSHAAMREEYSKNPDLTPMAIESLVSRRGQSTRGSIQDVINRATGGLQSEVEGRRGAYEQAQGQRSNLLEDYQLQYQSEQDALDRLAKAKTGSGGLTTGQKESSRSEIASFFAQEGNRQEAEESAKAMIQKGYQPDMVYTELNRQFPEESTGLDQEAVSAYVEMINDDQMTIANVPKEYKAEVSKAIGQPDTQAGEESPGFLRRIIDILGG